MPETDIVLGDSDVEVRAGNLAVTNSEGPSTVRADQVAAGALVLDNEDSHLSLSYQRMTWENDVGTLTMSPSGMIFPTQPGGENSTLYVDVITGGDETRTDNLEATVGHFVDGTFGGNAWGTEEPVAGTVEVMDDQGNQTILLDGSRGVVETSGGDVAEYFPNGTDESYDGGEVVALEDGEVVALRAGSTTDGLADCEAAFVVASTPMLLGNRPSESDTARDEADHVPVALLGQVSVEIAGDVQAGDRLVATADGRAVSAADGDDGAPTVGRALESAPAGGEASALVGYSPAARDERIDELRAENESLRAENETLRAENETLRAENEALRDRLAAVEERLATVEEGLAATEGAAGTGATPADD